MALTSIVRNLAGGHMATWSSKMDRLICSLNSLLSFQLAALPGCQFSKLITTTRTSPLISLLTLFLLESHHAVPTGAPCFKDSQLARTTEPQEAFFLFFFKQIRQLLSVLQGNTDIWPFGCWQTELLIIWTGRPMVSWFQSLGISRGTVGKSKACSIMWWTIPTQWKFKQKKKTKQTQNAWPWMLLKNIRMNPDELWRAVWFSWTHLMESQNVLPNCVAGLHFSRFQTLPSSSLHLFCFFWRKMNSINWT